MGEGLAVEIGPDPDATDIPETNDRGDILSLRHPDGSVSVSITDEPIESILADTEGRGKWFANLAEQIDGDELARIADEIIRGVADDEQSRSAWIESRAEGLKMLGLKMDVPSLSTGADGAPVEGQATVRHPLLLEAVLRFQANARSELLPTDGPVKIRNDDNNSTTQEDALANALEKDLNHYLTSTATEYYPDTDRMLLMTGFGGTGFKKVYYCPLRERPVSESVDAVDLIVNNEATDLNNARRVTHRIRMRPSVVRRMQLVGAWRDVDLGTSMAINQNSADLEKKDIEGVAPVGNIDPEDRDREIYECYCELDIKGFEHKKGGKATGLDVPYRVVVDVSSREVLSVVRNYNEDTKDLPVARKWFVKYPYVPGFGFYDIGLVHILGNTTNALTASWRIMLDNGMYNNFPGGLIAKSATRQNSNIFRVSPGSFAPVETGGMPIQSSVMPLPYSAQGMPALLGLVQEIESAGQRVGSIAEIQVGEGSADAPVGTTMALIDQASKIENSVHKRLFSAQAEEIKLLCGLFEEHPEAFWERNDKPSTPWDKETFLTALRDYDLVPQADPNTSSHTQRLMKVTALKQLQGLSPRLYDPVAIDRVALQTLGFSNPEQFFLSQQNNNAQQLEMLKEVNAAQVEQKKADAAVAKAQADTTRAQADVAEVQAKIQSGFFQKESSGLGAGSERGAPDEVDIMQAETARMDAETKRMAVMQEADHHHVDTVSDILKHLHQQATQRHVARASRGKSGE